MAFQGYYLKIGSCTFQSPAIKREGYKLNPRIVQVTDSKVLASGKISIKELPHKPTKITVEFPVMTPSQWAYYASAFRGALTGEDEMYLTVTYFDSEVDNYRTGTFYHGDLSFTETTYEGQRMLLVDAISLVEH